MAQNIILKRSALPGKVPDTGSLNLGEIGINTYDGRAFIHKSGSTESVEQIVVTNSITTGSITILQTGSFGELSVTNDANIDGGVYVSGDIVGNGDIDIAGAVSASVVSASIFYGDGSQLTGVTTTGGTSDNEIPSNDWDYNLPDSGTLSDGNNQSTKYTVDFQAEGYGTRPVGYQTFITNTNGSTEIIPGTDSIVFIVNDLEVGRIDEGGIIGNTPLGTISSSAQIAALGYVTSSAGSSTDITALNTFTASADISITNLNTFTSSISTASLVTSITNLNDATSSYETMGRGIISGSSQLTSSYDTRYTLSGSVSAVPSGTISGSSQLTSSFDLRYLVTGSVTSSINQLNTFTASVSTASLVTSITNINSTTASLLIETSNLEIFSASVLSRFTTLQTYTSSLNNWTSSVATTGSNSFNGNQTITGSLIVSSVAVVNGGVTIPTASIITLTSGSSISIDSSGAITGSLTGSVFGIGDVVTFSSSVDSRIKGLVTTASFNSFTSSHNTWTSSVATTGSNSFNGSQTITGSLLVSGSTIFTGSLSISSGSITMPNRPAVRVTGAGGAKVAVSRLSGSYLNVDYDQGGAWDNASGTFTAPIAGLYQVNLVVRTNSNSLGTISQLIVYKNNTTGVTGTAQIMVEFGTNTTMNHAGGSTISKLAVGDTLRMVVASGEISFDSNDNFSVAYIG